MEEPTYEPLSPQELQRIPAAGGQIVVLFYPNADARFGRLKSVSAVTQTNSFRRLNRDDEAGRIRPA
jgi:hypothetical protein